MVICEVKCRNRSLDKSPTSLLRLKNCNIVCRYLLCPSLAMPQTKGESFKASIEGLSFSKYMLGENQSGVQGRLVQHNVTPADFY